MEAILDRAGKLKDKLSDFVLDAGGELAVALETFSADRMKGVKSGDMNQREMLLDRFLIEGRVGDTTPIDLFLPTLTEEGDKNLVRSWQRGFIGLFAIENFLDNGFEVRNQMTAKHYTVRVNNPRTLETMKRYKVGEIILGIIVPLADGEWLFFSPCLTFGNLGKTKLAVAIGNFKQNYPDYLYSDAPELLEESWKSVEIYHRDFLEFFGRDNLVLSGYELGKKLNEFQEWVSNKRLDKAGLDANTSIGELIESAGISDEEREEIEKEIKSKGTDLSAKMIRPKIELPPHLKKAEIITVFTDPCWGQMFLANYHQITGLLKSENWRAYPSAEKLLDFYLKSPEVNYFIWRTLVDNHAEKLEIILREFLGRPDFNLNSDLEPLLREYGKRNIPELPEIASVPLHLHELFQAAYLEVNRTKVKSTAKKTAKGFQK